MKATQTRRPKKLPKSASQFRKNIYYLQFWLILGLICSSFFNFRNHISVFGANNKDEKKQQQDAYYNHQKETILKEIKLRQGQNGFVLFDSFFNTFEFEELFSKKNYGIDELKEKIEKMLEGADKRVLETKLYLFEIFIKEITEIAKYDDITEEKNSKEKSLNYLENFIQNLSEKEKEKIKVLEEEIKVLEEKEKNFNLKEFVQRKNFDIKQDYLYFIADCIFELPDEYRYYDSNSDEIPPAQRLLSDLKRTQVFSHLKEPTNLQFKMEYLRIWRKKLPRLYEIQDILFKQLDKIEYSKLFKKQLEETINDENLEKLYKEYLITKLMHHNNGEETQQLYDQFMAENSVQFATPEAKEAFRQEAKSSGNQKKGSPSDFKNSLERLVCLNKEERNELSFTEKQLQNLITATLKKWSDGLPTADEALSTLNPNPSQNQKLKPLIQDFLNTQKEIEENQNRETDSTRQTALQNEIVTLEREITSQTPSNPTQPNELTSFLSNAQSFLNSYIWEIELPKNFPNPPLTPLRFDKKDLVSKYNELKYDKLKEAKDAIKRKISSFQEQEKEIEKEIDKLIEANPSLYKIEAIEAMTFITNNFINSQEILPKLTSDVSYWINYNYKSYKEKLYDINDSIIRTLKIINNNYCKWLLQSSCISEENQIFKKLVDKQKLTLMMALDIYIEEFNDAYDDVKAQLRQYIKCLDQDLEQQKKDIEAIYANRSQDDVFLLKSEEQIAILEKHLDMIKQNFIFSPLKKLEEQQTEIKTRRNEMFDLFQNQPLKAQVVKEDFASLATTYFDKTIPFQENTQTKLTDIYKYQKKYDDFLDEQLEPRKKEIEVLIQEVQNSKEKSQINEKNKIISILKQLAPNIEQPQINDLMPKIKALSSKFDETERKELIEVLRKLPKESQTEGENSDVVSRNESNSTSQNESDDASQNESNGTPKNESIETSQNEINPSTIVLSETFSHQDLLKEIELISPNLESTTEQKDNSQQMDYSLNNLEWIEQFLTNYQRKLTEKFEEYRIRLSNEENNLADALELIKEKIRKIFQDQLTSDEIHKEHNFQKAKDYVEKGIAIITNPRYFEPNSPLNEFLQTPDEQQAKTENQQPKGDGGQNQEGTPAAEGTNNEKPEGTNNEQLEENASTTVTQVEAQNIAELFEAEDLQTFKIANKAFQSVNEKYNQIDANTEGLKEIEKGLPKFHASPTPPSTSTQPPSTPILTQPIQPPSTSTQLSSTPTQSSSTQEGETPPNQEPNFQIPPETKELIVKAQTQQAEEINRDNIADNLEENKKKLVQLTNEIKTLTENTIPNTKKAIENKTNEENEARRQKEDLAGELKNLQNEKTSKEEAKTQEKTKENKARTQKESLAGELTKLKNEKTSKEKAKRQEERNKANAKNKIDELTSEINTLTQTTIPAKETARNKQKKKKNEARRQKEELGRQIQALKDQHNITAKEKTRNEQANKETDAITQKEELERQLKNLQIDKRNKEEEKTQEEKKETAARNKIVQLTKDINILNTTIQKKTREKENKEQEERNSIEKENHLQNQECVPLQQERNTLEKKFIDQITNNQQKEITSKIANLKEIHTKRALIPGLILLQLKQFQKDPNSQQNRLNTATKQIQIRFPSFSVIKTQWNNTNTKIDFFDGQVSGIKYRVYFDDSNAIIKIDELNSANQVTRTLSADENEYTQKLNQIKEDLKRASPSEVHPLIDKIDELQAQFALKLKNFFEQQRLTNKIKAQKETLQGEIAVLESQINNQTTAKRQEEKKETAAKNRIVQLTSEINTLTQNTIPEKETARNEQEKKKNEAKTKKEDLAREIEVFNQQNKPIESEKKQAEQEENEARRQKEELERQLKNLQIDKRNKEEEKTQEETKENEARSKIDELTKDIDILNTTIQEKTREKENKEKEENTAKTQKEKLQSKITDLESQIKDKETKRQEQEKKENEANTKKERLQVELKQLEEDLERKKAEKQNLEQNIIPVLERQLGESCERHTNLTKCYPEAQERFVNSLTNPPQPFIINFGEVFNPQPPYSFTTFPPKSTSKPEPEGSN
ncbi:hypothetical protein [Candidatus Phytoplasma solani]